MRVVVVIVVQSPQRSMWHEAEMFTDRVTVQTWSQTAFGFIRWLPSSHSHVSSDFPGLAGFTRFTSHRRQKTWLQTLSQDLLQTIQWRFDILKYKEWRIVTNVDAEHEESMSGLKENETCREMWWNLSWRPSRCKTGLHGHLMREYIFGKWRSSIQ